MSRAYRQRPEADAAAPLRGRVLDAVRDLLGEGRFHVATMEEIAERAGVSRAGLYLHFRSRASLVDAICETIEDGDELKAMRSLVADGEPRESLRELLGQSTRFWVTNEPMFRHLYGLAEIDDAARAFVERQTEDRRKGLTLLAGRLRRAGDLREGLRESDALARLLVLTSLATYLELRHTAGLSERSVVRALEQMADDLVLAG